MAAPTLSMRPARRDELQAIVRLLADDVLGATRERVADPLPASYAAAFDAIAADPNNELIVACLGDEIVGVLQLTYTPGLAQQGSWRATVEGVRIAASQRGQGRGTELFAWVFARARARGCAVVQLTTDKRRIDARRFYERLGFVASHEGMKKQVVGC